MNDTPSNPEACGTGSGFYVPGTQDVACDEDHASHLDLCAHCGATLSPNSEFCQVCAVAVSGGEAELAETATGDKATGDKATGDKAGGDKAGDKAS